jgi:hypothetical protein
VPTVLKENTAKKLFQGGKPAVGMAAAAGATPTARKAIWEGREAKHSRG